MSLVFVAVSCGGGKDLILPPTNVGISGDSLSFAGGAITLIVPESALVEPVQINVTITSNVPAAPTLLINGGLDITVEPAVTFLKPITVRLNYQDADIPAGVLESEIGIYRAVNGSWQKVATSSVNAAANQVTVELLSFSTYGILGAPVASVTVTPNPASVVAGSTVNLSAIVEDIDGNDLTARTVTWGTSASGTATVASGAAPGHTAVATGVAAGNATITATSAGVDGSTPLTVTAINNPPPPPPPTGPHNEPGGYTALVERGFTTKAATGGDRGTGNFPNKVGGSEGWDDVESQYPLISIQPDPTAPNGAPFTVMRFQYSAGTTPAGNTFSPGVTQTLGFTGGAHGNRQFRQMYARFWFRYGPIWQNHPSGSKLMFYRSNDTPGGKFEPIVGVVGQPGALRLHMNFQGTQDNGRGQVFANAGSGTDVDNLQLNTWYKVEVQMTMNTAFGTPNGVLQMWLNGVRVMNYTDVRYLRDGTNSYFWEAVHIAPTWGGQAGTINTTMFWFLDHLYVSGRQ